MGSLSERGVLNIAEITMSELTSDGEQDDASFLARVDLLVKLGYHVLISDYLRFFRLSSWIRNFTNNRIAVVMSVYDLNKIFDEAYYEGLEGGILVAMGKLFSDDTNVFVYPAKIDGELVTLDNAEVPEKVKHLLRYLMLNKSMVAIEHYKGENLHISPPELAKQMQQGRGEWEKALPPGVAEEIIEKHLFRCCV
ncbi:MAG: TonB-dependent receptor, partial [Gammaproteobacteria bacterium]|nr:TonB-dependent receptor [Gammaproteobacteria bacterium]